MAQEDVKPEIFIINCANWFSEYAIDTLKYMSKIIKSNPGTRFYCVGIGAQSELDKYFKFSTDLKKAIKDFVKAILDSGGSLGLRGYYTLEVLKKLGFNEEYFSVIGCPSMYVNGRDFQIVKENLIESDLKTIITDKVELSLFNNKASGLFTNNTTYICQDTIYPYLYSKTELPANLDNNIINLFNDNKIKIFLDIDEWQKEICKHNFSFGCRFHGNALAITNNVPAVINVIDSRTKELAEFFEIPYVSIDNYEGINLFKLYEDANYSNFNKNFAKKFDNFKAFFDKNNIPNYIGKENAFVNWLIQNKSNPLLRNYPYNHNTDIIK